MRAVTMIPLPVIAPRIAAPRRLRPSLSVVVVNHRQWGLTAQLVRRLRRAAGILRGQSEIVLVDNHSPAHPLLTRLRRLEGVSLRRWGRNRGFAQAVNEGVRLSEGRWILLLNPDMSLPTGFLDRVQELTKRLDREQPRTGIVGLGLLDDAGRRQPSTGPFPTFLGTLARLLLPRRWRKYDLTPVAPGERVDWVSGCAMLVRRELLDQLGGLDPAYFLYYEDVDLCRRARESGWDVRYEPGLVVRHHHPLHDRRVSPHLRLLTRHALLTYASRHWPEWQMRWLARIVRVEAWVKSLIARKRGDPRTRLWMLRLGRIARRMQRGRTVSAARILRRAVEEWDELSAEVSHEARPVDRHPELQSARPAPGLSEQRPAPCPVGNADPRRR